MSKDDIHCLNEGLKDFRSYIIPISYLNIFFKITPIFTVARDFVVKHFGAQLIKIVRGMG